MGGAGVGFDLPILEEADDAELSSGREVAEARASIWRWKRVEAKEAAGEAPKPNEPSRAFPPLFGSASTRLPFSLHLLAFVPTCPSRSSFICRSNTASLHTFATHLPHRRASVRPQPATATSSASPDASLLHPSDAFIFGPLHPHNPARVIIQLWPCTNGALRHPHWLQHDRRDSVTCTLHSCTLPSS